MLRKSQPKPCPSGDRSLFIPFHRLFWGFLWEVTAEDWSRPPDGSQSSPWWNKQELHCIHWRNQRGTGNERSTPHILLAWGTLYSHNADLLGTRSGCAILSKLLSLGFLSCKMGINNYRTQGAVVKIKWTKYVKGQLSSDLAHSQAQSVFAA